MTSPGKDKPLLVDFGERSVALRCADRGADVAVERDASGTLTTHSRAKLREAIQSLLGGSEKSARRAVCALPARGISLRRWLLPRASPDETRRLASLQVEREFPLPPADLAWGLAEPRHSGPSANGLGEVVVAAVRRPTLSAYEVLLAECGLRPVFAVRALSASSICRIGAGSAAVLTVDERASELLLLENGTPSVLRTLAWGEDALSHSAPAVEAIQELAVLLREAWLASAPQNGGGPPPVLYLVGRGAVVAAIAAELGRVLLEVECRAVAITEGPGRSAATCGLEVEEAAGAAAAVRFLSSDDLDGLRPRVKRVAVWPWAITVILLGAAVLASRYAAPLLRRQALEERVNTERSRLAALPPIDRELEFLATIERSQSPFIEALAAVARLAPPGTIVTSLSMNRQGAVALAGSTGAFTESNSFREKLALSGQFAAVTLQEQIPNAERNRVSFRMVAELRASRPAVAPNPPHTPPAATPAAPAR